MAAGIAIAKNVTLPFFFQVMQFIQDLFSFQYIRLTTLEEMTEDVMKLARIRLEGAIQHLQDSQS